MSSHTVVELREMDTIRAELVDKYIALGHTEEVSLLLGSLHVMCDVSSVSLALALLAPSINPLTISLS